MTGRDYEEFVRSVLSRMLRIPVERMASHRLSGRSFPNIQGPQHQVDLYFEEETEAARYVTIVECKYRSSSTVDQQDVQNLAFVKSSLQAEKAILVTNRGFTLGAWQVAKNHGIALMIVSPPETATSGIEPTASACRRSLAAVREARAQLIEEAAARVEVVLKWR